ncbi:hypothetical protein ZMO02_13630 [Zymomonas mobilis subsp. pomaceae]|uniref:hypothetical protein n=1 Tax=Zymomonas mobilis TaxID=542 RepID=UPI00117279CE|nr:hypothetical protein [Zymomonas mobilis]GEB89726.1 hypothetical protein ZMO02_13630 [Zymomonas mobilis subsp. pomaceae]
MKIYCLFTAVLAFASTAAIAGNYQSCRISSGMKSFCGAPFSGEAVIQDQGRYKNCRISSGMKSFCGVPFSGEAVITD